MCISVRNFGNRRRIRDIRTPDKTRKRAVAQTAVFLLFFEELSYTAVSADGWLWGLFVCVTHVYEAVYNVRITGRFPPSFTIAYPLRSPDEISDLREIYGAERRHAAGSSGGAPRTGGRSPRLSRDVCAEPLPLEVLWKPGAFPPRGRGLGGCVESKNRAGRTTAYFVFGSGGPGSVYAS